jgi:hypothetical protein
MTQEQADRIEQKLDALLSLGQEILEGVGLLLLCEVGDEPDEEDDIFPPDMPLAS